MRWLIIFLIILSVIPSSVLAFSTVVQDTDSEFQANNHSLNHNQTQVRFSGPGARLELLFGFSPLANITTPPPDPEDDVRLCYETKKNLIILFGGVADGALKLGKTWQFDPSATNEPWTQRFPLTFPSPRSGHGLAASGDGKVIMFGGIDGTGSFMNDTWIFDISQNIWSSTPTSTAPSRRQEFAMASDTTTKKVLLFGGAGEGVGLLEDTWVYDIDSASWVKHAPLSNPSKRSGAAMTFNCADNKFYLFGGNASGTRQNDLWRYDLENDTWGLVNQGAVPPARENAGMCFDTRYSRLVLWGGIDPLGNYENDGKIWYFDTAWYSGVPASTPVARQSFGMAYVQPLDKIFIFGGQVAGVGRQNDSYYYVYRATGDFTSAYFDVGTLASPLTWLKLDVPSFSQDPNTSIKFQISTSTDNKVYSQFSGIDGTPGSYYGSPPEDPPPYILSPSSATTRYLKYKVYLASLNNRPPLIPSIDRISLTYNFEPYPPQSPLITPLDGGCTNYINPLFSWKNFQDPDQQDTLSYRLQIDTSPYFTSLVMITTDSIADTSYRFSTNTPLNYGTWYWRVQAYDGTAFGAWSAFNTLYVDTLAPNAVTDLAAESGDSNKLVKLTWTNPPDLTPAPASIASFYTYQLSYSSAGPVFSSGTYNSRQTTGQVSSARGEKETVYVSGLLDATTYYFAVMIADSAGNFSGISTTSPWAYTNAPPSVHVSTPSGNENWSGAQVISWTASDPNPGDTLTFSVNASTDAGSSFGVLASSGLPNGATYYLWNTNVVPNGNLYMIKVTAQDRRGLSDYSVSAGTFTVFNPNEAPSVTIVSPQDLAVASATLKIVWSINDPNAADTHTYDIYISSDGGTHYPYHFNSALQSYSLNTKLYPNGPSYAARIVATDSGNPPLSGTATRAFKIDNSNYPPNAFSLISPNNGSARSPLDLVFSWENNGDPNTEDTVSYTLCFSTSLTFFPQVIIPAISANTYKLNPTALQVETTYFWKVSASDPLGLVTDCRQLFWGVVLSRKEADSSDGRVHVEILEGLPDNGYIKVDKIDPAGNKYVMAANQDTLAGRNIRVIGDDIYRISICDVNDNLIAAPLKSRNAAGMLSGALNINATVGYKDSGNKGYFDGTLVPVANLRAAMLNETAGKWELVAKPPVISKSGKNLTTNLNRTGFITLTGALIPSTKISSLTNYPNPFKAGNETTRIRYVLTEDMDINAAIYSLTGNLVYKREYSRGSEGARGQATGYTNEIQWDGKNNNGELVANGMYIFEIYSGSEKQVRKIGVVK